MVLQNIATLNQSPIYIMKNNTERSTENDSADIRCFCKKHAAEYINTGSYILKRLNYGRTTLDKCDKCDRLGFDFILIEKKDYSR